MSHWYYLIWFPPLVCCEKFFRYQVEQTELEINGLCESCRVDLLG